MVVVARGGAGRGAYPGQLDVDVVDDLRLTTRRVDAARENIRRRVVRALRRARYSHTANRTHTRARARGAPTWFM